MYPVIHKMTQAYGLFKGEHEAIGYGMGRWGDGNFEVSTLKEVLEGVGLNFEEA